MNEIFISIWILIFIWVAMQQASLWYGGLRQLGNELFLSTCHPLHSDIWLVPSRLHTAHGMWRQQERRKGRAGGDREGEREKSSLSFSPYPLTSCSLSRYPSLPALYEDDWWRVSSNIEVIRSCSSWYFPFAFSVGQQEDLSDLITALLKLNCFLSTTVAKQCTFFYNPAFIISSSLS